MFTRVLVILTILALPVAAFVATSIVSDDDPPGDRSPIVLQHTPESGSSEPSATEERRPTRRPAPWVGGPSDENRDGDRNDRDDRDREGDDRDDRDDRDGRDGRDRDDRDDRADGNDRDDRDRDSRDDRDDRDRDDRDDDGYGRAHSDDAGERDDDGGDDDGGDD